MRHRIEEILYVQVQNPLGAQVGFMLQSSQGIVWTTTGAISKAVAREARLPIGREDLRRSLLDDTIGHGWNGEKPEAACRFGDVGTEEGLRPIAAIKESHRDGFPGLFEARFQFRNRDAVHTCATAIPTDANPSRAGVGR